MTKLNLPTYNFQFKETEKGLHIFDSVRKKFIFLTLEEWVRQNFIQYLINDKKYPSSLIAIETGLKYNQLKKRSDITIYDRKGEIWMIVECKKPTIKISRSTFDQIAAYNMGGKTKSKFLTVTNGIKHYCCQMCDFELKNESEKPTYAFLKNIPEFD